MPQRVYRELVGLLCETEICLLAQQELIYAGAFSIEYAGCIIRVRREQALAETR